MKTLYLLRHAHALAEAPPMLGDHERVLSAKGAQEAENLGLFMKEQDILPDYILSSSSVRTIQTARIVMSSVFDTEGRRIDTRFDRSLYLADPGTIISTIREVNEDYENLLVIGHNPGMAELAHHLSHGTVKEFPPCTFAVFETTAEGWDDFDTGKIELKKVFIP